jgi:hypothetical protein
MRISECGKQPNRERFLEGAECRLNGPRQNLALTDTDEVSTVEQHLAIEQSVVDWKTLVS